MKRLASLKQTVALERQVLLHLQPHPGTEPVAACAVAACLQQKQQAASLQMQRMLRMLQGQEHLCWSPPCCEKPQKPGHSQTPSLGPAPAELAVVAERCSAASQQPSWGCPCRGDWELLATRRERAAVESRRGGSPRLSQVRCPSGCPPLLC